MGSYMNERILELAREAGFDAELMQRNHDRGNPSTAEKFAELIVRDCALTAGLMEQDGRKGIGAAILDNYGVE